MSKTLIFLQGDYKQDTNLLWTYSKDEAWGMTRGFFTQNLRPGGLFAQWRNEIVAAQTDDIKVPSPYPEKLYETLFPDFAAQLKETYGCGNDANCESQLTKFVVATQWVCSTRFALQSSWPSNNAKLWAVQYEEPTCEPGTS